jgi:protein-S-isoprenylcysteine O-methyltransferase Ste14
MRMALDRFTAFLIFQLCAALIVILVIVFRPGPWSSARWTGLGIALPAAVLLFIARGQLGRSFSVTAQARQLVTHGLYSRIRNPIYVFGGLMVAGILVALQRPYTLFFLIVLIPVQVFRANKEAKVLEAKFGEVYREYRAKTWF